MFVKIYSGRVPNANKSLKKTVKTWKTRGRFFVCQPPITVDKEYIYQDGVYTW